MMKKYMLSSFSLVYLLLQPADATTSQTLPPLDSYKIFNLGPDCRYKLKISKSFRTSASYEKSEPYGSGEVDIEDLQPPQGRWGINFRCIKSDDERVKKGWAVFDDKQWKLNEDQGNKQLLDLGALHFFQLETKVANGWAITFDETFGDEKFRQRTLSYCLVRKQNSVCGVSKVGYLDSIRKNHKSDFTQYVLRMLNSIEFLEDVQPNNEGMKDPTR